MGYWIWGISLRERKEFSVFKSRLIEHFESCSWILNTDARRNIVNNKSSIFSRERAYISNYKYIYLRYTFDASDI